MTSEELDSIRSSHEKLGKLTPIILDAHGNHIDGDHRLRIDPKWKDFNVTLPHIKTRTQLILARFSINTDRRIVSADEKTEWLRELHKETSWDIHRCSEELGKAVSTLYPYWPDELKDKQMQALKQGKTKAKDSLSPAITDDLVYKRVCKEFDVDEGELSAFQVGRYLRMEPVDQRRLRDSFKTHREKNGDKSKPRNLFNRLEKKLAIIVLKDRRRGVPQTAQDSAEVHQAQVIQGSSASAQDTIPRLEPQGLEVKYPSLLSREGTLRGETEFSESYNPSYSYPNVSCKCKGCEIGKEGTCLALTLYREDLKRRISQ